VAVNMTGPFLTCPRRCAAGWRRAAAADREHRLAAAFHGSTSGHAHYAASKAGLVNFTVSLAAKWPPGHPGQRRAPGIITTEMAGRRWSKIRNDILERIPLRRIADPAEVATWSPFSPPTAPAI